jgi:hypothetical protein
MGFSKNIIDELKKHNLLIYFIILWGGSMFLYAVANLATWGFGIEEAYDVLWIIGNLFNLGSGSLLTLFGLKLMNTEILKEMPIEKTFAYFLLLWAGQFIFWGLSDIIYFKAL